MRLKVVLLAIFIATGQAEKEAFPQIVDPFETHSNSFSAKRNRHLCYCRTSEKHDSTCSSLFR